MDIQKIIAEIQQSECCNCQLGKVLIALKGLLDQVDQNRQEPVKVVHQRRESKNLANERYLAKLAGKMLSQSGNNITENI